MTEEQTTTEVKENEEPIVSAKGKTAPDESAKEISDEDVDRFICHWVKIFVNLSNTLSNEIGHLPLIPKRKLEIYSSTHLSIMVKTLGSKLADICTSKEQADTIAVGLADELKDFLLEEIRERLETAKAQDKIKSKIDEKLKEVGLEGIIKNAIGENAEFETSVEEAKNHDN